MELLGKKKKDENRVLAIDEKAIRKTHDPHGEKKPDVSPLFTLIKEILNPSATTHVKAKRQKVESSAEMGGHGLVDGDPLANSLVKLYKELKEVKKNKSKLKPASMHNTDRCSKEWAAEIVPQISFELWKKCPGGGGDADKTMIAVFNMLSCYSWEVKIVLTLAAFALIYKDSTSMAESLMYKDSTSVANNIEPIQNLIDDMVELTDTIVNIHDSRPENSSTHILAAVSWTVRSVVACTSHIRHIEDELSKLKEKVVEKKKNLGQLLHFWRQQGQPAQKVDENLEYLNNARNAKISGGDHLRTPQKGEENLKNPNNARKRKNPSSPLSP